MVGLFTRPVDLIIPIHVGLNIHIRKRLVQQVFKMSYQLKPHECDIPRFDPMVFLHLLRGKKFAFTGDSVARNHIL